MPQIRRSAGRGRVVTGLDIEPGAVRAVQARVIGSRIVVERSASAVLEPTTVRDGEVLEPDALAAVLRDLFAEHKFDKRVRIGVANQRLVVRHLLLPPITDAKQLATAIRFLAADELPMPIDQAVLDHVVLGPVETPEGPRTRVLVVAARRSMIDTLLAAALGAGLRPEGIDLAAFAMVRALGSSGTGATLHLSVGGVVNLAVTRDRECVFTRVVAGGTEAMAGELAERQMISIEDARDALRRVTLGPPAPAQAPEEADGPVFPGAEPRPAIDAPLAAADPLLAEAGAIMADGVRRIAGEVRNSIDFHLGADPGTAQAPVIERVQLTGPVLSVGGFAEELSRRLAMPVDSVDVEGAAERGGFAVAAGLAVAEAAA